MIYRIPYDGDPEKRLPQQVEFVCDNIGITRSNQRNTRAYPTRFRTMSAQIAPALPGIRLWCLYYAEVSGPFTQKELEEIKSLLYRVDN